MTIFASNKKANYLYQIIETYETGIVLKGYEVKAIVQNNLNINDAFVVQKNREAFVINMHVAPYSHGNINNGDPLRNRKLLLHKSQIQHLFFEAKKQRLTVIVLKVYKKTNKIKLEIALAKSKKLHDKRASEKEKDIQRELNKNFKRK